MSKRPVSLLEDVVETTATTKRFKGRPFKAVLPQAGTFKKILEGLKDLLSEATFQCTSRGISVDSLDPSHIAFVSMLIHVDSFEEYECGKSISIGMNVASVLKILKCANNDDKLTITTNQEDFVTFIIQNHNKLSTYNVNLINIESEMLVIPETDCDAIVSLPSKEFVQVIKQSKRMANDVTIRVVKGSVEFAVKGEMGNASVVLSVDENISIDLRNEIVDMYALEYLNRFTLAAGIGTQVTLKLAKGQPLSVEYKIQDLAHIRYYLSPKLSDN